MQLEQRFELPTPPAAAWVAFQDIGLLVDCLPGASLTGPAVAGDWPLRFDVKLGPIAAGFAGNGRLQSDDSAMAGRFEGQAADKRTQSRVKGVAAFQLSPGGAGTVVQVTVDYALTGSLAQFSRGGIVRELAGALTAQFAHNLAARLQQLGAAGAEPGAENPGGAAAEPGPTAAHTGPAAPPTGSALATALTTSAVTGPVTASVTAPKPAVPLSALGLIGLALKARWQRLLRRWRGLPSP